MTLTVDDKTYIKETVVSSVINALEQIVLPRFDAIDEEIRVMKGRTIALAES